MKNKKKRIKFGHSTIETTEKYLKAAIEKENAKTDASHIKKKLENAKKYLSDTIKKV